MSLAANIQTQDYKYQVQVPQGTWRWTTRVDVSKASPVFSIRDVISPYGILRDTIPIPGTVVTSMAESITDLESAFAPSIVISPNTLTFTVNEAQWFCMPQYVTVSNGGVYGSLLAVAVTSSATYVQISPANVSSLAFNASGQFAVTVDSSLLLAVNSPYSSTLTLVDTHATNNPIVIPVNIVVVPLATIAMNVIDLNFEVSGNGDGTFPPVPAQTFRIQNTGPAGSSLVYQVQKLIGNSPWLVSFNPTYGTLASTAYQTTSVVVQPTTNMQPGVYEEILRVSGYSSNSYVDLPITFTVM